MRGRGAGFTPIERFDHIKTGSSFTDRSMRALKGILYLYAHPNIYRSFKDQDHRYQFMCYILALSSVTSGKPMPCSSNVMVCSALLDLHRGGLECTREQYPGLHRAKNEGQQSLITTLKHHQHLFKPKTTLSPGINLLNHLIINLSREKVRQQEPICQQPLADMRRAIFYWEQREKGLPSFINFKHRIYLCGKQEDNRCK